MIDEQGWIGWVMDGLDEGLRFYPGYNFGYTIENMIYSLRINLVTVSPKMETVSLIYDGNPY